MGPDLLAISVLATLDGMGPKRLAAVIEIYSPGDALDRLRQGRPFEVAVDAKVVSRWRAEARLVDDSTVAEALAATEIVVSRPGDEDHPRALTNDIDPSPVLFRRGRPIDETRPAVAIVGTRRCTGLGRDVARELGCGLAAAGVSIVSGLALGIDGAAHEGALAANGAPPVAFVGGGADVVYPRRHRELWDSVIASGTIASEAPPGAAPTRWRFPARNRLIAAMSDLVVVVESRRAGGSLLTVDEAIRRDRQVMAVPGSVRNPAAVGTNSLLADGCAPVTSVDDVLLALGLSRAGRPRAPDCGAEDAASSDGLGSGLLHVLGAIDDGATPLDAVMARTGCSASEVLAAIGELAGRGLVVDDGAQVRRA